MIKLLPIMGIMLVVLSTINSQSKTLRLTILDQENSEPLIGATAYIQEDGIGAVTDFDGVATFSNVIHDQISIEIAFIGYMSKDTSISLPTELTDVTILLEHSEEELEEVVISTTRSTRTIKRIPTRIEFIGEEELEEKAIMNAANISLVLRESTGIQIQQSSLSSGNSSIRIQGLDGRFTQLLKDGFPLFGGFSGGLSIMQIPPLDLNQFEVIKGSSSTLYGGGAIAGLVNMVSKTPSMEDELDVMLSQTHAGGSTINAFLSQRRNRLGWTVYGSAHHQIPYDPDGDGFSNLPQTTTFSFNPKLFWYPNESSTLWVGINAIVDDRVGGDITVINEGQEGIHQYREENDSRRLNSQAVFTHSWGGTKSFQVKNSLSIFDRLLTTPTYTFDGQETNTFTEVTLSSTYEKTDVIIGANLYSNSFDETTSDIDRDQADLTAGAFGNLTTDLNERLIGEIGVRLDHARDWGTFALPRISLLWKANDNFSSRFGGGLGYKTPDLFTEEAAMLNFQNVLPVDKENLSSETSIGINVDANLTVTLSDEITASINQLFYLTSISNALLLNSTDTDRFNFVNASSSILSRGAETNVKFNYKDFRWFVNYAFIDTRLTYLPESPQKPLTPRHNAGTVLMYETDDWRIGLESYYTGKQLLSSGEITDDFVMMGLLIQKHFPWGSPYINFENFTDRRQSRYSPEVFGRHEQPDFAEIYAPTDGFIFSMGIKMRLIGEVHRH